MDTRYIVIPIYNTVVMPETDTGITTAEIGTDLRRKIEAAGSTVVLLPGKDPSGADPSSMADAFHEYGVLTQVDSFGISGSGTLLHVATKERVRVFSLQRDQDTWTALISAAPETKDLSKEAEQDLVSSMLSNARVHSSAFGINAYRAQNSLNVNTINEFAVVFGGILNLTGEEKYELLSESSMKARGELLSEDLQRYIDSATAAGRGQTGQKKQEKDYRRKIEESGMPEDARQEVGKVLDRYLEAQPNDPEKGTMETYLDFVTDLKWKIDPTPELDLVKARQILDRDHYGLDKVKERILQQIAVMSLKQQQAGSILLLVGAPGTGKTSMGKSIAEALGRKYVRISLGGVRDEAEIRGHRRTYIGAMPGRIMDGVKRAGSMNPVVVLDEIDKLGESYNGDPASALLEVLDPEQNNTFTDHYLNIPYDLSNVFFICTANTIDTIPGPLYDRMEVIQLSGYTPMEKLQIAHRYLLPRAMESAGITTKDISVDDGAVKRIIEEYTAEAGVRGLKKQLDVLCRHRAAEIVESRSPSRAITDKKRNETGNTAAGQGGDFIYTEGSAVPSEEKAEIEKRKADREGLVTVRAEDIPKYLGNKRLIHDRILDRMQPGIVTGLAWTQVGGEILYIETRVMKGSGQIIVTGQLGDVMKESARIALSLVKSAFISDELSFDDKDIHIHVPEGAVKKDGPSAGITLFTALTSLVTGIPVSNKLAMTGEVSLRGQVMPIGGLPEKLMAADRAGITKVLIPKDNVQDLEDVPKETRDHLTIVPVTTVADVAREALGIELPKAENVFRVTVNKATEVDHKE